VAAGVEEEVVGAHYWWLRGGGLALLVVVLCGSGVVMERRGGMLRGRDIRLCETKGGKGRDREGVSLFSFVLVCSVRMDMREMRKEKRKTPRG